MQGIVSCYVLLRVCSFFLLLLAFFCDCSWGSALSLDEYRSSIQEALSRVESGKGPLKPEESAFFDESFPPHLEVKTKSGEPVRVANGALLRLVKESQENDQGRESLLDREVRGSVQDDSQRPVGAVFPDQDHRVPEVGIVQATA